MVRRDPTSDGNLRLRGRACCRARTVTTARGVGTHHRGHAVFQHPLGGDLGELGLPELVVRLGRHLLDHLLGLLRVLELQQALLEPLLIAVCHRLHALLHDAFGGQLLGLRVPVHVLGRRLPLGARDEDGAATRGAGTDARGGRVDDRRGGDASDDGHCDDGNVRVVSRAGALGTCRRSGRARAGEPSVGAFPSASSATIPRRQSSPRFAVAAPSRQTVRGLCEMMRWHTFQTVSRNGRKSAPGFL